MFIELRMVADKLTPKSHNFYITRRLVKNYKSWSCSAKLAASFIFWKSV